LAGPIDGETAADGSTGARSPAPARLGSPVGGAATFPPIPGPTNAVHRHGRLRLRLALRGGRAVVAAQEVAVPAGTVRIVDVDGDGTGEVQITNPSGGLLAGDRLETQIDVGAGVRASLVTQGANRIYGRAVASAASGPGRALDGDDPGAGRAPSDPCPTRATTEPAGAVRSTPSAHPAATALDTRITVDDGATLEWAPHHLMPFARSRVRQRTLVDVADSGALLAWESLAAGRSARGERFAWDELDTRLRIVRAGRPLLADGALLGPGGEPFDGADLVATVVVVLSAGDPAGARLADDLHRALDVAPGTLASASAVAPTLVVARIVARDAPALYRALHAVRERARPAIGLPPPRRPIS
jgi:urease accessory protein